MNLLKFRVSNFKTIEDSGWIKIENITCFVGENESGKTNVLTALLKLKPADDDIKIDLISDYPRHRYTEEKDEADDSKFIEAIFKTEQPFRISFSVPQDPIKNEETGELEKQEPKSEIREYLYARVERYYSGEYKVYVFNNEDEIDKESKHIEIINQKDTVTDRIPKFVYYASYANLSSELYLPNIISDLQRYESLGEKEKNKAKTLKVLFKFVNLSAEEILDLGRENNGNKTEQQISDESKNKKEREIMLDSASSGMTRKFKEWWKQGDYKFKFSADGNYFRIWVSDNVRPENVELENRSSGLQWFFSFYLVFITESQGEHANSIILLDEPGHTLHPMAQKDLSVFFNELSKSNQLLYTTHSPFLVDPMNITRTKVVYVDEKGNTNVSDDLKIKKSVAKKSIYPVNSAIGITISDTMLIGSKAIIVEGTSDQIYLTYIKRQLMQYKSYIFDTELVFMPVDGTKNIKPVVSIITGKEEELPFVLVDGDEAGKTKAESLEKGLYSQEKAKIVKVNDYINNKATEPEIEDIMDANLIEQAFNREFHSDSEDFKYDSKSKDSIIKQIEKFADENEVALEIGWKVIIARKYVSKNDKPSDKLLENWEKLFNKFTEKEN